MGRIGSIAAIAGALVAGTLLAPSAGAQDPDEWIAVDPSPVAPGDPMTISGRIDCVDMGSGGHVVPRIELIEGDTWVVGGWGETYPALDAERTFELDTTMPTTVTDYITRETVPTPPGEYRIVAFCGAHSGAGSSQVASTFTVVETTSPTTTTQPQATTTTEPQATTTSAPTASTTSEPAPSTTTPTFAPPPTPPSAAEAFEHRPSGAVPAGGTIGIDEGGFAPGEEVHIVLYSEPTLLATVEADGDGRIRTDVTVPADTEAGEHTLVLYGASQVKAMAFDVVAATGGGAGGGGGAGVATPSRASGSGSGTSQQLPRTGSSEAVLVAAGLLIIAAGVGTLRIRRRMEAAVN